MDPFPVYNKHVSEGKEIEMTDNAVNDIEDMLRKIETLVEEQGQRICSDPNKAEDWHYCNQYLEKVDDLIHGAYRFRWMDE